MSRRRLSFGVVAGTLGAVAVGCAGSDDRLVVFAASSLTDVVDELVVEFEDANPGTDVVVNTGGSSSLVAQLIDGADVDVLLTADTATMERAVAADVVVGDPVVIARNELVIAVEAGNPAGIEGLADLARDDLVVVLAAPDVPAGAYAAAVLGCAAVDVEPASLEQNVRSAAAKVELGEADAAVVYRTDIGVDLDAVEIDPSCQVDARYPAAVTSDDARAADFVDLLTGPAGRSALSDAGFLLP